MILNTQRLCLRRAEPRDASHLFAAYGDAEVMRYWSSAPDQTVQDTAKRLKGQITRPDPLTYFVIDLDGKAIGNIGMWQPFEIGFILAKSHWRKGYTTEAMRALIPYLFDVTEAPALTADIDPRNTASHATLRRLGFRETGRATNTYCINGEWSDSLYLALDRPPHAG